MGNVKFRYALVFFVVDAKKSSHSQLYNFHNG